LTEEDRRAGRDRQRAAARRRRRLGIAAVAVLVSFVVGVCVAAVAAWRTAQGQTATPPTSTYSYHVYSGQQATQTQTRSNTVVPGAEPTTTTQTTTAPRTSSSTSASSSAHWTLAHPPRGLRIVKDLIPYTPTRLAQMRAYSERHYGVNTYRLHPMAVVLHFTATSTYSSAHDTFVSNAPNGGEEPGVCAQYIVDQDGTVYEQVPPTIQCRHTIGLDDVALGIENVQITGPDAHWADQQILHRPAQITADLKLVKWLQAIYHIPTKNIIGHAMANDFYLFRDREGWTNDHTDWQPEDVYEFRQLLDETRLTH